MQRAASLEHVASSQEIWSRKSILKYRSVSLKAWQKRQHCAPGYEGGLYTSGNVSTLCFFAFSVATMVVWTRMEALHERHQGQLSPRHFWCIGIAPLETTAYSWSQRSMVQVSTTQKFGSSCPLSLTSHQVQGERWAPGGPPAEPGTFLISFFNGNPLYSTGGIGERWA